MSWHMYLHEWLHFMANVGKYASPMDPMAYGVPDINIKKKTLTHLMSGSPSPWALPTPRTDRWKFQTVVHLSHQRRNGTVRRNGAPQGLNHSGDVSPLGRATKRKVVVPKPPTFQKVMLVSGKVKAKNNVVSWKGAFQWLFANLFLKGNDGYDVTEYHTIVCTPFY